MHAAEKELGASSPRQLPIHDGIDPAL